MLRSEIYINNFECTAKEYYLFVVPCANHIVHGLVAAHIQSEAHDSPFVFRGITAAYYRA